MSYELAFDKEGEPIEVTEEVVAWRVFRLPDEGAGRPSLVYDKGKPLIIRVAATHAELLGVAGRGRYKLEPVNAQLRSVEGVSDAQTGPLAPEGEEPPTVPQDQPRNAFDGSAGGRVASMEHALIQAMNTNARALETMVGEVGRIMSGAAELLRAAHPAGMATPMVLPMPQAIPLPPAPTSAPPSNENNVDLIDVEIEDEIEAEASEPTAEPEPFGFPEVVKLFVSELADKLAAIVVDRVVSSGLTNLPVGALLDWRKAKSGATATASPAAPAQSAVYAPPPTASAPSAATAAPVEAPIASAASVASSATTAPHVPVSTAAAGAAAAGATPTPTAPPPNGVAPAEPTAIASAAPPTQEELAAAINAHFLEVWRGLSAPERARATQLIARLTDEERAAWFSELAGLAVPDAIARARAFLENQTAAPPPTS